MRIAHICDLHITSDDSFNRDVDVKKNFSQMLELVKSKNPDFIVLGGDLAAVNGEIEAYDWIKSQMETNGIPYFIVAGNHDLLDNLQQVFKLESVTSKELFYKQTWEGRSIFVLDSSSESVSRTQLEWLSREVNGLNSDALLFMHHPPLLCGCNFMDSKYPLKNRDEVIQVLNKLEHLNAVFCGHYHTEKTVISQSIQCFITPSTMLQMDQDNPKYQVSSLNPGFRIIDWDGQELKTSVYYLNLDS